MQNSTHSHFDGSDIFCRLKGKAKVWWFFFFVFLLSCLPSGRRWTGRLCGRRTEQTSIISMKRMNKHPRQDKLLPFFCFPFFLIPSCPVFFFFFFAEAQSCLSMVVCPFPRSLLLSKDLVQLICCCVPCMYVYKGAIL